jgi:IS1 family transposase
MNVLGRNERLLILKMMCRDSGITDIEYVTGHAPGTVRRYLAYFGEALLSVHDRLVRDLKLTTRVQVDEMWSYVFGRSTRITQRDKAPPGAGDIYTWTAQDPDNKLFVTSLCGRRDSQHAIPFLADLQSRLAGRVLLTSDASYAYPEAVEIAFGANVDHVVIRKVIASTYDRETADQRVTVLAMHKIPQGQAEVDLNLASTSLVERHHATMRSLVSRLTRRTLKFSKRLENHIYSHNIFSMYYNFVRPHRGFKGKERHYTPAIKAGICDRVWTFDDLLDEVDAYWWRKTQQPKLELIVSPRPDWQPLPPGVASIKPFFVMFDPAKREAKVHAGQCNNCRYGLGRKDGPKTTQWFDFDALEGARFAASHLAPHDFADCTMCIRGYYRTMEQPA